MNKNRVIIDTNIWVSIFISAKFTEFVNLILNNGYLIYSSPELIYELTEVLSRKKFSKYLVWSVKDYISLHKNLVKNVKVKNIYAECPDPKDNFLFDIAIQKKVQIIVTGDKKLLNFSAPNSIKIITFKDFREL